ncbi:MAG TPA: adenylate/guanylate cyclase domain-containing protein [Actinomycetota bacterium]
MDQVCPSCDAVNPSGARFCMSCGAALGTEAAVTERRIVTILFVDLVGFTERSDRADPEDVRRALVPYHAAVKSCLERFGGTLDKFIGDAVMGVFGAPTAHEDDPARAVDAALAIRDEVVPRLRETDPDVAVRIAVNTGPALVSPGAGPQVGEAVAGDVVNTASRLHALAEPGEIVIGELSERAVRDDFEMDELPPATVKGKAEPVRVWRVRSRCEGTASPAADVAAFVGREVELRDLLGLFDEAVASSSPRTAVVIGEPGIGKSRLIRELHARLGPHRWLPARCQPYGEDVALRPAGVLVEAALGLGHDAPGFARALDRALDGAGLTDGEREGARAQLDRLFGAGESTGSLVDLGAAITTVLEQAAGEGPIVVVVEDLHWADAVLARLTEVVRDQFRDRAVLFVGTSRTEVHGDGRELTITLGPLPPATTGRLVDELLARFSIRVPSGRLVDRTGGNPLYALEFVRAMAERGEEGRAELPVPESLQAVIGARLDAVPTPLRTAVSDAAVVGPEFWIPAVAALDVGDEERAAGAVTELVRRGVLERDRPTWLADQPTYRFAHALFREVAYGRLPREVRAEKHLRTGKWLEAVSATRAAAHADAITHHYVQAYDLATATGRDEVAMVARPLAAAWLNRIGERNRGIDPQGSYERFSRAMEIATPGSFESVVAQMYVATMGARLGLMEADDVLAALDRALEEAIALRDPVLEARARLRRSNQMAYMGAGLAATPELDRVIELLEPLPPGPSLAEAYAFRAEEAMLAGETERSIEYADRALEMAQASRVTTLAVMALHIRGNGRIERLDPGGLDDLREALRLSEETGDTASVIFSHNYLGEWSWLLEGPEAGLPHIRESRRLSELRGLHRQRTWAFASSFGPLFDAGRWDELVEAVEVVLGVDPALIDPTVVIAADVWGAKMLVAEGRPEEAADPASLAVRAREIEEMHVLAPGLLAAALIHVARDEADLALPYLEELDQVSSDVESPTYREEVVADAARSALAAGDLALAARFAEGEGTTLRSRATYATARAALAEARGDADAGERWTNAARAWEAFGAPYEEALAWEGVLRTGDAAAGERAAAARARVRHPA